MKKPGDGEIYFIANIPHQIEVDWDKRYAHLAGFPLNIMFTGLRKQQNGTQQFISACYWFDPGTYPEDEVKRQMRYVNRTGTRYHVEIIIDKRSGMIETSKYKGESLISQGNGKSFDQAIIHATLCGLEPDEGNEIPQSELNGGC